MVLYLVLLVIFWIALRAVGDHFWLGTIILFSPRWLLATPLLLFIPLTLLTRPKWTPIWLVHALVITFPICDFRLNALWSNSGDTSDRQVAVMSCNLGGGDLNTDLFWQTVDDHRIDIIAIQECSNGVAEKLFKSKNWYYHQWKHLAIGSRLPLRSHDQLIENAESYRAAVALSVAIEFDSRTDESNSKSNVAQDSTRDSGRFRLNCIHLPTPRPGIEAIFQQGPGGIGELERFNTNRLEMARSASKAIRQFKEPTIVVGDFNAPCESHLLTQYFGDYENAFSKAGFGLGWSKRTKIHGVRIDHILYDSSWAVKEVSLGPNLGGDHRPMIALLARRL